MFRVLNEQTFVGLEKLFCNVNLFIMKNNATLQADVQNAIT
jgi:hypothetical protein